MVACLAKANEVAMQHVADFKIHRRPARVVRQEATDSAAQGIGLDRG